jgi:hypothetical protein
VNGRESGLIIKKDKEGNYEMKKTRRGIRKGGKKNSGMAVVDDQWQAKGKCIFPDLDPSQLSYQKKTK